MTKGKTRFLDVGALVMVVVALLMSSTSGAHAEMRSASVEQTPGNRLMFSPQIRELALFKGAETVLAGAFALLVVAIGALQVRKAGRVAGAASIYAGTYLFYAGWVVHKWTLSGRPTILQGHLASWAIAALGMTFGIVGLSRVFQEGRPIAGTSRLSLLRIFTVSLFLTLGIATGTALVFEVTPTLCGINPGWACIAGFVGGGALVTSFAILTAARNLGKIS